MVNMTLAIPEELHAKMKHFNDVKWSEVARRAIEQRISDLELMNKLASKSKLTNKDVEELSSKIKRAASNKFLNS